MLRINDFIREFPVLTKTDRDCEVPLLLEFLQKISPIDSLLDVGAHHSGTPDSYSFYAAEVRKLVKRYDGIDILDDPILRKTIDNYYVGNANEYPLEKYDVVICVSTIEHAGISTYKVDQVEFEQYKLFKRCLDLTKKYMWISFPVGQLYIYPDQLSIITDEQLKRFETLTSNFKVKQRFFYSQGPQADHPWREHTKREVALKIPYIDYIGNQSVAVLEIDKT